MTTDEREELRLLLALLFEKMIEDYPNEKEIRRTIGRMEQFIDRVSYEYFLYKEQRKIFNYDSDRKN